MSTYTLLDGWSASDIGEYGSAYPVALTNDSDYAEAAPMWLEIYNSSFKPFVRLYKEGEDIIAALYGRAVAVPFSIQLPINPLTCPGAGVLYEISVRLRLHRNSNFSSTSTDKACILGFGVAELNTDAVWMQNLSGLGASVITDGTAEFQYPKSSGTGTFTVPASVTTAGWFTVRLKQRTALDAAETPNLWSIYVGDTEVATDAYFIGSAFNRAWYVTFMLQVFPRMYSNVSDSQVAFFDMADPLIKVSMTDYQYLPTGHIDISGSTEASVALHATGSAYYGDASLSWTDLTVTETGNYSVTVTDEAGGSVSPVIPVVMERDAVTGAWNTGSAALTITVTQDGTYTYTASNATGSGSDSYTVELPRSAMARIFEGHPVPEGAWLFGQSNAYRTGIATVQSQYSASPRILALAGMYWDMLNPGSEIQTMLDDMLNPSTARGYGLDVWGRIVGIKRATVPVSGEYLAFDPDPMSNPDGDSWNNAPFNPLTPQGLATDTVFRVYVMVKAMMNIGNGSLADLNRYFSLMFPGSGIQVIHAGTMIIRVLDYDAVLTDAAIMALRSIDWVPAGVGWQVWQGEPDCFGFLGSELQPFDQAPFISNSALIFE